MTARTCPVHGEYSASGVCRWCEEGVRPARPGVRFVMDLPAQPDGPVRLPGLKGLWARPERVSVNEVGVPEYTWTIEAEESPAEELARKNASVVGEPPGASALRDVDALVDSAAEMLGTPARLLLLLDLSPLRISPREPQALAIVNGETRRRIDREHAALRWERVARRWGSKHPLRFIYLSWAWIPGDQR